MWLLYGERGTTITDVATLQWQIFSRSQAESQIMPPTRGTIVEHTLSAHVQSIVWTMAGVAKPSLPSHVQYACWTEHAVKLSPLVTKFDPASVELGRCSSKCSTNRCSCKKNEHAMYRFHSCHQSLYLYFRHWSSSPDQLIITTRGQRFHSHSMNCRIEVRGKKSRFFQNDGLRECKITRFMLLPLTLLKIR